MRILHVNKFLYRRGGAEAYMLDVARLQENAGHSVEFFSMQHPENNFSRYSGFFPLHAQLNPPPKHMKDRIQAAGGMFYRPSARRGLEAVIDDFQPDVVHVHNIYHQLSPAVLRATSKAGVRTVMTLHDYKLACPTYRFLDHGNICEACLGGQFRNAAQRRCNNGKFGASLLVAVESSVHRSLGSYDPVSALICPSEFMARKMLEAGVFPERLVYVPHFCDFESTHPADSPGADVVVAGRLSMEKGVDVAISAMAHVPRPTRLLVAGDGPEREKLEEHARVLGVADRVIFIGHLRSDELQETIRAAAAVIVPSRWYENQPMIVLESFACARPVVASALGGLPEMIQHGETGYLVPHNNPGALGEAIAEMVADPVKAHEMGMRGRLRSMGPFSPIVHLRNLEAVYSGP